MAQAAGLLGCSKPHVYRLIKAGEFPMLDIATPGAGVSKTRIRESDLREYLARPALGDPHAARPARARCRPFVVAWLADGRRRIR